LEFAFHEEQAYIIRAYDEDLRYATDLKEHDYLGGCTFTLGQLMGAKGCAIARRLAHDKSYMVVTGDGALPCLALSRDCAKHAGSCLFMGIYETLYPLLTNNAHCSFVFFQKSSRPEKSWNSAFRVRT
jgi:hypothetical protein